MGRRISPKRLEQALARLLPHKDMVIVEPFLGGGRDGRTYGLPALLPRTLIVDEVTLIRDQYDSEVISSATVFIEADALAAIPVPETRVTIWAGTAHEREAYVVTYSRHFDPLTVDLLEVKVR